MAPGRRRSAAFVSAAQHLFDRFLPHLVPTVRAPSPRILAVGGDVGHVEHQADVLPVEHGFEAPNGVAECLQLLELATKICRDPRLHLCQETVEKS